MKIFFTLLFYSFFILSLKAQNFNGQWKGGFVDNSVSFIGFGGEKIDYVLELETKGSQVTGYSYTYFTEMGKRYYTICKLRGTINRTTQEIVVTEYERTKYNTPPEVSNCFQTHRLKYAKQDADTEILQGTWIPAPNQSGHCGHGRTSLSRNIIKPNPLLAKKKFIPPVKKDQPFRDMNRAQQPVTKQTNPVKKPIITSKPQVKNDDTNNSTITSKRDTARKEIFSSNPPLKKEAPVVTSDLKFERRINTVLKTIPIKNETFTVDFYDNGVIDGDSISVFYNGKLVLANKRLSNKPITLTLTADADRASNDLVMYAENLGEIPPNTALMIVRDGDNRYEARITSDTEKNGTIRFSYKPKEY